MRFFLLSLLLLVPFFSHSQSVPFYCKNIGSVPFSPAPTFHYDYKDPATGQISYKHLGGNANGIGMLQPGATTLDTGSLEQCGVIAVYDVSAGVAGATGIVDHVGCSFQIDVWLQITNCYDIPYSQTFNNQNNYPVIVMGFVGNDQLDIGADVTLDANSSGTVSFTISVCDLPNLHFIVVPLARITNLGGPTGAPPYWGDIGGDNPPTGIANPGAYPSLPAQQGAGGSGGAGAGGTGTGNNNNWSQYTNTATSGSNSPIVFTAGGGTNIVQTDAQGFNALYALESGLGAQAHSDAEGIQNGLAVIGTNVITSANGIADAIANSDAFLSNVLHGLNFGATNGTTINASNVDLGLTNYALDTTVGSIFGFLTNATLGDFSTNDLGDLVGDETNAYDITFSQVTNYSGAISMYQSHEAEAQMDTVNSKWSDFVGQVTGFQQDDIAGVGDMTFTFPGGLGTMDLNPLNYPWFASLANTIKSMLSWILAFFYLIRCINDVERAVQSSEGGLGRNTYGGIDNNSP